jgi:hypothetical protein
VSERAVVAVAVAVAVAVVQNVTALPYPMYAL